MKFTSSIDGYGIYKIIFGVFGVTEGVLNP